MPRPSKDDGFHFEGFDSPNTTAVPDQFFDVLAPHLGEAELRVLLYVIRRTFGFKKESDNISLKQMVEGITTRDGRTLDLGAGLSMPSAIKATKSLAEKGVITTVRNRSVERGDEATTYTLCFKNPVLSKFRGGSKDPLDAGLKHVKTQQTVIQQNSEHHHDPVENLSSDDAFRERSRRDDTGGHAATSKRVGETLSSEQAELLAALLKIGITKRQAERLVREYPADRIRVQLASLPHRQAKDHAAYLVQAIKEGYDPARPLAEAREKEEAQERRRAAELEAAAEEEARRQEEAEQSRQLEDLFASLAAEDQEAIRIEAAQRLSKISPKFASRLDTPMGRANIHLVLQERYAAREGQRAGARQAEAR